MSTKALKLAVAYLRTSSAANVGMDKDSERRQRQAIEAFARSAGYEIADTYYDAAVSGADPVTARPGFSAMLERLLSNGVRTILVENASRFARDLIVQETGYEMLKARGIELIAVDSPDSFVADTPTANLIRQVLGAVSEFEKAMLVEKLRGARERKRRETGRKVGGRKSYAEMEGGAELIALAKKLHRYSVNGRRRTLAEVAKALADAGHLSGAGTPFTPTAVLRMVGNKSAARRASRNAEPAQPIPKAPNAGPTTAKATQDTSIMSSARHQAERELEAIRRKRREVEEELAELQKR
jgi:DNA invertase Pin-like site-specific DNA recombinase